MRSIHDARAHLVTHSGTPEDRVAITSTWIDGVLYRVAWFEGLDLAGRRRARAAYTSMRAQLPPGVLFLIRFQAGENTKIGDEYRAHPDVRCTCGLTYRTHPASRGHDFLHRICSGERVKL